MSLFIRSLFICSNLNDIQVKTVLKFIKSIAK